MSGRGILWLGQACKMAPAVKHSNVPQWHRQGESSNNVQHSSASSGYKLAAGEAGCAAVKQRAGGVLQLCWDYFASPSNHQHLSWLWQ